ncbi:MAG: peptidylprolyl isomerase [Peptostreptococcaceae bacterium]|nr:peptidylprolyl isomerase [Peptostreptococcaceae bacterium]
MENKTLAIVNGKNVTRSDLDFMFANLNPQLASQFVGPEGEKKLLSELINQKLLLEYALESKIQEEDAFKTELEKLQENLLSQFAVKRVIDSAVVSEEDAKKFYEDHPEYFVSPEQIRASHILVADEDKANELYNEIQNGGDFALLAADHSTCPSAAAGGDLNYFSKGQMVPEFEEAVFALEKEEISKPVKTQFGYHIIKLTEKKESSTASFEDAKNTILQNLTAQAQHDKYNSFIDELKRKYPVEMQ